MSLVIEGIKLVLWGSTVPFKYQINKLFWTLSLSHAWISASSQDWVKVLISKMTLVSHLVFLHQREQLFTQVCAAKHRVCFSSLGAQLGDCVGDKTWKLCSTHRLIFCPQCVTILELSQLHLEVWWWTFHISCKWIRVQPAFLGCKIAKLRC